MALTGLQILKLLPNTNCRDCDYPTCLAFAMKLAAGKEALDHCPHASEELKSTLGAASAPPIRAVTIGQGDRAVTLGEETVYFRHEKTFVRPTRLFAVIDPKRFDSEDQIQEHLEELSTVRIERAGEVFLVDGVAVIQAGTGERAATAASLASGHGLPVAVMAASVEGARMILDPIREQRPLLIPRAGSEPPTERSFFTLAAELGVSLVVSGAGVEQLATEASEAQKAGVSDLLLEPVATSLAQLHQSLSQIRRAALDRAHPGLGYPVFLHLEQGAFEKGVVGITKFASLLTVSDRGGETWLPLWVLRQNIYTDPQKPLQIDPGVYPIGEPDEQAPLLVTTNFSLTYFTVSTELEGSGVSCWLAVVDAEGMSVLTAWSAGKLSGDKVGKELLEMGALDKIQHKSVIIPGYVAVISGELEDALGPGWRVTTGPQEASDISPFFREMQIGTLT